jgi:hypothetical protein
MKMATLSTPHPTLSPVEAERVAAELEHATAFLRSRYIEGLIEQAVTQAVLRSSSPWLDRAGAAAYVCCSTSEIDRAARAGVFPTYQRGSGPLFRKEDLDRALTEGRWRKRSAECGVRSAE